MVTSITDDQGSSRRPSNQGKEGKRRGSSGKANRSARAAAAADWASSQSLVELCGKYSNKCGYCKLGTNSSVSYGMLAARLTCADYQELIDRGWRRSGTFVYKPIMHETCCPQYTIRLEAEKFKPTKGQRHVLNRLHRYLKSGDDSATINMTAEAQKRPKRSMGKGNSGKGEGILGAAGGSRASGALLTRMNKLLMEAARAVLMMGPFVELGLEKQLNLTECAQVKPNQGKVYGDGFGSAVAVRIAATARKKGWVGQGGGGGSVAVAEAIAERLRDSLPRVVVNVAPNGFLNFVLNSHGKMGETLTLDKVLPPHFPGGASTMEVEGQPRGDILQHSSNSSPKHLVTSGSEVMEQAAAGTGHRDSREGGQGGVGGASTSAESTQLLLNLNEVSGRDLPPSSQDGNGLGGDAEGEWGPVRGCMDAQGTGSTPSAGAGASPCKASPTAERAGKRHNCGGDSVFSEGTVSLGSEGEKGQHGGEHLVLSPTLSTSSLTPLSPLPHPPNFVNWGTGDTSLARMDDEDTTSITTSMASSTPVSPEVATGINSLPPLLPERGPHCLKISTRPACFTEEVYNLYRKYQISVHGEDPSEVTTHQFKRFLVDSPLMREEIDVGGGGLRGPDEVGKRSAFGAGDPKAMNIEVEGEESLAVPYGSYHQLYRIDGQLIAVGVVDILPKCLSSVYLFYDLEYRALALGKLTVLLETEFVRKASALRPLLRHYYMGYYIHSCPKMYYKGSYYPSSLLCPERPVWVPLELCRPALDRRKYVRLSDLLAGAGQGKSGVGKG
ncbi:unnamed protein product, partial [Choristocarpus tenellus]